MLHCDASLSVQGTRNCYWREAFTQTCGCNNSKRRTPIQTRNLKIRSLRNYSHRQPPLVTKDTKRAASLNTKEHSVWEKHKLYNLFFKTRKSHSVLTNCWLVCDFIVAFKKNISVLKNSSVLLLYKCHCHKMENQGLLLMWYKYLFSNLYKLWWSFCVHFSYLNVGEGFYRNLFFIKSWNAMRKNKKLAH